MTWVQSAGGPLLAAPQSQLPMWSGSTDVDGPVETWGDYGRACRVDGYIGLVAIGAHQGLVLADEPAPTAYLPTERLLLRWAAAYSERELVDAAEQAMRGEVPWSEELTWDVTEPVVLFDSAAPGMGLEPGEYMVIDLTPGSYQVRAASVTYQGNWMILVQLQPL